MTIVIAIAIVLRVCISYILSVFRRVAIVLLLLYIPLPVYFCLFDLVVMICCGEMRKYLYCHRYLAWCGKLRKIYNWFWAIWFFSTNISNCLIDSVIKCWFHLHSINFPSKYFEMLWCLLLLCRQTKKYIELNGIVMKNTNYYTKIIHLKIRLVEIVRKAKQSKGKKKRNKCTNYESQLKL